MAWVAKPKKMLFSIMTMNIHSFKTNLRKDKIIVDGKFPYILTWLSTFGLSYVPITRKFYIGQNNFLKQGEKLKKKKSWRLLCKKKNWFLWTWDQNVTFLLKLHFLKTMIIIFLIINIQINAFYIRFIYFLVNCNYFRNILIYN